MKRLLDTNAYVALKRGHLHVADLVRGSTEVIFSVVVIGELVFGFRNGTRMEKNHQELDEFLASPHVVVADVTRTTADRFGRIATALRRAGTPIPSNDMWIAAHAFETGAELVTFDRHFDAIAGLVCTQLS